MKSVVVTGGTTRLGKAIAERLSADGWYVITTSHRDETEADIIVDLSKPDAADFLYAAAKRRLRGGEPDALVNNAAIYKGDAAAIRMIDGTTPRKLIEMMADRKDGVGAVVNILDAGNKGPAAYQKAKRSLRAYTKTAARRFLKTLRVNAVSPGPIAGLAPTAIHEKAGKCPLGRPSVQSVVDAVVFLLENPMITGTDLFVDGGSRLMI